MTRKIDDNQFAGQYLFLRYELQERFKELVSSPTASQLDSKIETLSLTPGQHRFDQEVNAEYDWYRYCVEPLIPQHKR